MFLRKKKKCSSSSSNSNNKSSPWPLQHPQNQFSADVALGFLPVDGDGIVIGVAVVTVAVEENAVEELSSNPLPA